MFDDADDGVDLVKMDIEGAEKDILLESDGSWLHKVRCLHIEVHGRSLVEPIRRVLFEAGFEVERSEDHWTALEAWRA